MTNYADITFYTGTYLAGKEAVIDTASFIVCARKASQIIKQSTLGNINEMLPIIEEVKMCCCEVAEQLFKQEQIMKTSNGIASEKVGEYAVSYVDAEKIRTANIDSINSIINDWLLMTGLMYRGGM